MTSTSAGGMATTTFAYNGDGLRNSRTAGGTTTTFTWDVARSLAQVLDDGAFKYVYGLGRIAEVGPGTTTHYYLPDGLGSTMALVNSSGTVVNTYNYDVFGAVRSSTGSQPNAFKFTGEQAEVLPVVVRLPLDPVVASTNLTGATVANLDEDPDSPDTAWATATSVADTALRVGFPTPTQSPKQGPGLQEFRVLLRKNAAGGNNPTYDIELWETGGASRLALLAGGVSLTSDTGVVVSATWDAALLGVANGANVEVRIVGHASSGSPSNRRTVEVGAVEWNALLNATDETLENLRARYYDMGTGRFVNKDSYSGASCSPGSQHSYSYVGNNPVGYIDPTGHARESGGGGGSGGGCECNEDRTVCVGADCELEPGLVHICDEFNCSTTTKRHVNYGQFAKCYVTQCGGGCLSKTFETLCKKCHDDCLKDASEEIEIKKCDYDCYWRDIKTLV